MSEPSPQPWPPVRLPWLAAAVAAGIAIVERTGPLAAAPLVWALAAIALALVAPWRGRARAATWLAIAMLTGAALGARERGRSPTLPAGVTVDDRGEDTVTGIVDGPVAATRWGSALRVDVDGGDARIGVTSAGEVGALPGDRVRVVGRLRTPRGYRNPGGFDRRVLAASRGVDLELGGEVEIVARGARPTAWRWTSGLQRRASAWVAARGGDEVGNAVVRGAVLGDRSAIEPAVDEAWRASGVYHVLSVSGMHLAVVALLAFATLRRALAVIAGGRVDPTRAAAVAAAALAIAYTMLTGAEVATLRALAVALVVLGGAALARRARAADALGLAALLILVHVPSALWDPGFQLSFAATAALLTAPRGPAPIEPRTWRNRGRHWLRRALAASLWVTLVTAPITALHFHQLAIGGVVGNLIATPVVELAVIPLALAGLAVAPLGGGALVDLAVALCGVVHDGVALLARATPLVSLAPPRAIELVAFAAIIAAWRLRLPRRAWIATVASLVLAASIAWPRASSTMRVTFLDVGQGDAAVIEAPGGEVWLIDAGGIPSLGRAPAPDGAEVRGGPGEAVVRFLEARRISRIDVAIVSHPHPDHYLGLAAIAARVPIDELWIAEAAPGPGPSPGPSPHPSPDRFPLPSPSPSPFPSPSPSPFPLPFPPPSPSPSPMTYPSFTSIAASLASRGTRILYPPLGIARWTHGAALRVLAPAYDAGDGARGYAAADPVRSVNDDSLVVAVEYAGRRALFLGDLEAEGEDRLVAGTDVATATGRPLDLGADLVKVPHHGSPTSSSAHLVAATHPGLAVISCGSANRFGFPSDDVVARWRQAGARVARTDLDGAITVEIDDDGATAVTTEAR